MSAHTNKDDILSRVKMELGIQDITNYDAILKDKINEHIREFDCFETYVKLCTELQPLKNGDYCLPDNFYELGMLKANCLCMDSYNNQQAAPLVYVETTNLKNWGLGYNNTNNWGTCDYQINGNRLVLMGNFINVFSVTLLYKAYNTDAYGNFIGVPKDFYSAVVFRIVHDFMLMPLQSKNYPPDTKKYYNEKALALFNSVRAKSARRDMNRRMAEMQDAVHALLPDLNLVPR
jgi:hypothetical protein